MPKMFSSANQYAPFSYLLDEAEQGYISEDQHHHHAVAHPQSCNNELAPLLLGGDFSDEHREFRHRDDFGMSLFYSEYEQQGSYNGTSSSRQGQQLLHQQQQDQEQQQYQQQQEYEARFKNLQAPAPSPFFIHHMQNLQTQEEFSRIMTAVTGDPSSKSSTTTTSGSTSSSSAPSQTRQRMNNNLEDISQQQQVHAVASLEQELPVPPPPPRGNTQIPTMPMIYNPSSMFHNGASAMTMYQEAGAVAFNRLAPGSSSGSGVMQLTDPSSLQQHQPHHVLPVSNNNNRSTSTYQESSLKHHHHQHHLPTMMMPFSRNQGGFDVSVDPLKRAQDITSSMLGHSFPSSFSHDATVLEKKDLEKKCYSRIVEAGISSSTQNNSKSGHPSQETAGAPTSPSHSSSTSPSKKKKEEEQQDVLRPLSAYNFFFSDERERLLNAGKDTSADVESHEMRKERLLAQHVAKDRSKRRPHRKTHGKITFTTLSKLIGQRWRQLPELEKNFFKEVAKADLMRYHHELTWTTGQKKQDMVAPIVLCYDQQQPLGGVVV
jgi:hypothetical protein